jgi:outer membrane protein assembly factor BamA
MKNIIKQVMVILLFYFTILGTSVPAATISRIDIVGNYNVPISFIKAYFPLQIGDSINEKAFKSKLRKWSSNLYECGYFIFVESDYTITDLDSIEVSVSIAEKTLMFRNLGTLCGSRSDLYNKPIFGIDYSVEFGSKSQYFSVMFHDILFKGLLNGSITIGHEKYSTDIFQLGDSTKKYEMYGVNPEISSSQVNPFNFYCRFPYQYNHISMSIQSAQVNDSTWTKSENNFGIELGLKINKEYLKSINYLGYSFDIYYHNGFSPVQYQKWFMNARIYFSPPIKNELALRLIYSGTNNAPFYQKLKLNNPRLLRATFEDHIIGNNLLVMTLESRSTDLFTIKTPMMRILLGLLVFADAGVVWDSNLPKNLINKCNIVAGPGFSIGFSNPIDLTLQLYYGFSIQNGSNCFNFAIGTMF